MSFNVAQKLIASHLVEGGLTAGEEIGLKIDQTLTQDATGTLVMLELEAMGVERVKTELSVQYVDHNLLQEDHKNPGRSSVSVSRQPALRALVQPPGQWRQPSAAPGAVRQAGKNFARFRQPHAGGRFDRHAGHRRRRVGSGAGHGRLSVLCENAATIWGVRLVGKLPDWVSAKTSCWKCCVAIRSKGA